LSTQCTTKGKKPVANLLGLNPDSIDTEVIDKRSRKLEDSVHRTSKTPCHDVRVEGLLL